MMLASFHRGQTGEQNRSRARLHGRLYRHTRGLTSGRRVKHVFLPPLARQDGDYQRGPRPLSPR
jgi:hypothetical protein